MRIHSTISSVKNYEFSILAFLESVVAISASIWFAWYFQTNAHLFLAAFIAPFLLLRTEQSTERGLYYFENFSEKSLKKEYFRLWATFSVIVITISLYFTIGVLFASVFFLLSLHILYLFWVKASTQTPNIRLTKIFKSKFRWIPISCHYLILGVIVAVGTLFAILLGSITIKVVSTLITLYKYPLETITEIPNNWGKMLLSIDSFHPPELLPGIEESNTSHNKSIRLSNWINESFDIVKGANGTGMRFLGVLYLLLTLLIYFPALLYRWSLKSTSIVWYPLIYVVGKDRDTDDKDTNLQHQLKTSSETVWAKIKFGFAFIAIFLLTILPLSLQGKAKELVELIPIQESFLITYFFAFQMEPWHWARLIASMITIILFLFSNNLLVKRESFPDAGKNYAALLIRIMKRLQYPFSIITISYGFYLLYTSIDWQQQFNNTHWLPI